MTMFDIRKMDKKIKKGIINEFFFLSLSSKSWNHTVHHLLHQMDARL